MFAKDKAVVSLIAQHSEVNFSYIGMDFDPLI